jgi:hypothetical protein
MSVDEPFSCRQRSRSENKNVVSLAETTSFNCE